MPRVRLNTRMHTGARGGVRHKPNSVERADIARRENLLPHNGHTGTFACGVCGLTRLRTKSDGTLWGHRVGSRGNAWPCPGSGGKPYVENQ